MTVTDRTEEAFAEILAEAMHTGYRKGTDSYQAAQIHRLINDMPDREWGAYVYFVSHYVWEWVVTQFDTEKEE